jgi:hypothetical protein
MRHLCVTAWRRLVAGILVLGVLTGLLGAAAQPAEYQVKAVFLFNFTQFVSWPRTALPDPQAPFVIGILGHDPFGRALDDAVRGEQVGGRPLVIERYRTRADLKPCQILFIDRSASADAEAVLRDLEHTGTLTVTDFDVGTSPDVIIRFFTENQRIRLRINVDSARTAGLTISSKLLRPSQVVDSAGRG